MPPFDVAAQIQAEVENGSLTVLEAADLTAQLGLFELSRAAITDDHPRRWVGYVAGQKLVARDEGPLLAEAAEEHPGSLLYYEYVPPPGGSDDEDDA